jgi:hypothetical protein
MKRAVKILALAATFATTSCEEPLTVECLSVPVAGLLVAVVDSITLSPPTEATLVARSPAFIDSIGPVEPSRVTTTQRDTLVLYAAVDRPGTYSVQVRSPGYGEWLRTTVAVTADACHVRTVTLTARLQHP